MAIHCPECGFVNAEGANYCQKCGAYLSRSDGKDEPTTMTYTVDESGEMHAVDIDEVVERHGAESHAEHSELSFRRRDPPGGLFCHC